MQSLSVAILARNEAGEGRRFRQVLERCKSFADRILLLDDGSTDNTVSLAREYGALIRSRSAKARAWGEEAPARAELWAYASAHCQSVNDWVLVNDADMELVGDPRELIQTKECNSIAFVLHDMWNETEYRADEYWVGHLHPRVWLVAPRRVPEGWEPAWSARGIHTGHLPANWPALTMIAPPDRYYWLHWSYHTPELRQEKYAKYMNQANQLTEHERRHAESILA